MRGLMIKDWKLLMKQGKSFGVMAAVSIFFVIGGTFQPEFVVAYLSFMGLAFAVSGISYDEFDNGMSFLFVSGLFSVGLNYLRTNNQMDYDMEMLVNMAVFILFVLITIVCLMLPIYFKFGMQKGQIIVIATVFAVIGVVFFIAKYMEDKDPTGALMEKTVASLESMLKEPMWMILMPVIAVGLLALSYLISMRIMKKKEY